MYPLFGYILLSFLRFVVTSKGGVRLRFTQCKYFYKNNWAISKQLKYTMTTTLPNTFFQWYSKAFQIHWREQSPFFGVLFLKKRSHARDLPWAEESPNLALLVILSLSVACCLCSEVLWRPLVGKHWSLSSRSQQGHQKFSWSNRSFNQFLTTLGRRTLLLCWFYRLVSTQSTSLSRSCCFWALL